MPAWIKNWNKFQHYKNRRPPWIRLYRDLLDDPEFEALPGDLVKTLIKLWLAVSGFSVDGELPAIDKLALRMHIDSNLLAKQIEQLKHWVEYDASYLLATCKQLAIPEGEQREIRSETEYLDPSLRSGSTNISVSTSEEFSLSSSITCKHSEDKDKTSTKTKTRTKTKTKTKTDGSKVWDAYSSAYQSRYGTAPVRNSKANTLCKRLCELLGADSAPEVAAYYLTSRNAWYVQKGHNLESLVADAGKLHTEWTTGRRITQTKAREDDRLQETGDMWQRVIDKYGE